MNKRTLLTLVLAAVVLFGTSGFAQTAPPAKGRFGGRGHNEFAGLNLTTDQKAQIRTIHQEQRAKVEALNKQPLTRAEYRTQSMSIRKEGRDKIVNGVLTGEQRAQMQQRQQQRQGRYRSPTSNQ
jgi:Spy/CpxP family protein refolding chaperone